MDRLLLRACLLPACVSCLELELRLVDVGLRLCCDVLSESHGDGSSHGCGDGREQRGADAGPASHQSHDDEEGGDDAIVHSEYEVAQVLRALALVRPVHVALLANWRAPVVTRHPADDVVVASRLSGGTAAGGSIGSGRRRQQGQRSFRLQQGGHQQHGFRVEVHLLRQHLHRVRRADVSHDARGGEARS